MNMRKVAIASLAAAAVLGLAACGGGGGSSPTSSGPLPVVDPDPSADAKALADARDAARDAWRAARAALAGIAGKSSADPAAYQLAVDAVADAREAYDAALAAATSAEAMRHQEDAEAANQMAMAQVAAVVAAYDADDIMAAQNAAKSAADAAMEAYEVAKAALAAVESIQGMDMDSYDTAAQKVADAKAAYDAAKAASDAAAAATLLADAWAQRTAAENAQADAETANTDAMMYAGMVQTAEDNALADAKTAAQTAYDAAKATYDAAAMRVAALESEDDDGRAKRDDDADGNYFRAKDALARAKTAHDAAMAANAMAQAATLSTDAASHQAAIDAAVGTVDTETDGANMYAGLVEAAYNAAQAQRNTDEQNRMDEQQRVMDVADARGRAMQSYMDADAHATTAEGEADQAEATAPGSSTAMAARRSADMAREAADAAKAAHDAITDDMTKEEADAEATKAATAERTANSNRIAALRQNGAIQTARQIAMEQQRASDVRAATSAASDAATAARMAAMAARTNATNARNAANDAKDAYDLAVRARTDSANAKKHADDADARATAAEEAAMAAETAATAAETAHTGIDADGSAADAQAAQRTAETEQGKAEGQRDMAIAAYDSTDEDAMGAKQLLAMAMTASGDHVLGLLEAANAESVTDADARKAAITAVAGMIGGAAGSSADADNDSTTSDGSGTVAATAAWPADTPDDATTPNVDESAEGMLAVTITGVGADIVSEIRASDATATPPVVNNADSIDGLPGFMHGFDITDDNRHVLVFTDKQQATALVPAKTTTAANLPVQMSRIMARPTSATDSTPTEVTGVLADLGSQVLYDHDGDPDTLAIAGTFACQGEAATCVLQVTDGKLLAIEGDIRFSTTTAQTIVAEVAANPMNNYLVFGVWLNEDVNADDTLDDPAFGAFAAGGTAVSGDLTPVEGTATYEGAAAGVKSTASAADFFSADATLTAKFGDETAAGTVSGKIHNIVAGGEDVPHDIYLDQSAIAGSTDGELSGRARMGDGTIGDGGNVAYPLNGSWSGGFSNPVMTDGSPDLTKAPGSIVGTFGVTMADDADTEDVNELTSFVGAFGAHKQ